MSVPSALRGFRLALLFAALLAAPAGAQNGTTGAGNPQDAVREYLEISREGDFEKAAAYLNLRALPPKKRAKAGPELARNLRVILDRTLWVDWEALSEEPTGDPDDGLPPGVDRVGVIDAASGAVEILVERVRAPSTEPQWRFATSTVARIAGLYEEFGYGALSRWLPDAFFTIRFFEVELWQWVGLGVLIILSWVLGSLGAFAVTGLSRKLASRTKTTLDDDLLHAASSPLVLFLVVALFYGGSFPLGLSVLASRFTTGVAKGLLIIAVTWFALRVVDVAAQRMEQRLAARGEVAAHTAIQMGSRIVKVFLLIMAVLSAVSNLGFNVTGLIAGLGVGGIAIALAAQKTFENFFGGIQMLMDRPIQVGQFCRYGDKIGTIESIGLRSTRVRSLDRTVVTIPNSEFSSLQLENFAARDRIRFHTVLGLRYETTSDQLRFALVELRRFLLSHPRVNPDPARVRFVGFGAYSLDLEIFAYVDTSDWAEFLAIREDLLLQIMDVVEKSGSGFAFPSQTLYVGKDDGLHAERTRGAISSVEEWRSRGELFLPDFPTDAAREAARTLEYPAEGSALATKRARTTRPSQGTEDGE